MAYGAAGVLPRERNAARPPCRNGHPHVSVTTFLAALFGLAIAAYMAVCLPPWAALCIALGAVVLAMMGGGALLAKALVACALALMAARFMRRREK